MGDQCLLHLSINIATYLVGNYRLFSITNIASLILKSKQHRTIDKIKHPAVRGVLNYLDISDGIEVQHHGDLPARSGLGSSSSFTAGLLHSLHALNGRMISKYDLAMQTIDVEQNVIGEKVGSQDQVMASMGGLNHIIFSEDGDITVKPVVMSSDKEIG